MAFCVGAGLMRSVDSGEMEANHLCGHWRHGNLSAIPVPPEQLQQVGALVVTSPGGTRAGGLGRWQFTSPKEGTHFRVFGKNRPTKLLILEALVGGMGGVPRTHTHGFLLGTNLIRPPTGLTGRTAAL